MRRIKNRTKTFNNNKKTLSKLKSRPLSVKKWKHINIYQKKKKMYTYICYFHGLVRIRSLLTFTLCGIKSPGVCLTLFFIRLLKASSYKRNHRQDKNKSDTELRGQWRRSPAKLYLLVLRLFKKNNNIILYKVTIKLISNVLTLVLYFLFKITFS